MKLYSFDGMVGTNKYSKVFKSREEANKYLEKVLTTKNLEVNDVIKKEKHRYEYVCDQYTRFSISRLN